MSKAAIASAKNLTLVLCIKSGMDDGLLESAFMYDLKIK